MNSKQKNIEKGNFYLLVTILLVSEQVIFITRYLLTRNSIFSHNSLKMNLCHDSFSELHFLKNRTIKNVYECGYPKGFQREKKLLLVITDNA